MELKSYKGKRKGMSFSLLKKQDNSNQKQANKQTLIKDIFVANGLNTFCKVLIYLSKSLSPDFWIMVNLVQF